MRFIGHKEISVAQLLMHNAILKCVGLQGNAPVSELAIGNIGTGNISTVATLNGRCVDGLLLVTQTGLFRAPVQ